MEGVLSTVEVTLKCSAGLQIKRSGGSWGVVGK